jgi:hypothetical protein
MVENLGLVRAESFSLVGEKSFTAIGANGKWRRWRFSERVNLSLGWQSASYLLQYDAHSPEERMEAREKTTRTCAGDRR